MYYDEENDYKIDGWTENAVKPFGDSLKVLKDELEMFKWATEQPILTPIMGDDGKETLIEVEELNDTKIS